MMQKLESRRPIRPAGAEVERVPDGTAPRRPAAMRADEVAGETASCGCRLGPSGWEPNLSWVMPDLAVGGRVPDDRVAALAERAGIGAVVDLRRDDRDDAAHLLHHGIAFLHLPTDDLGALRPDDIASGTAFAARAAAEGRRLLVHCEHGIGRSATLALCVLVDRGLEPLAALRLAKERRELVSPSPEQYECWVAWLRMHPGATRWTIPDFDAFRSVAYRYRPRTGSGRSA